MIEVTDRTGNRAKPTVSAMNILMLFAPKFDGFGCDVARALATHCNGGIVHGLCTGPPGVLKRVAGELGDIGGKFWRLPKEEETWLSTPTSVNELNRIEQDLGTGAFGRIVTADRRVGRGFVRGGLTRPDGIGNQATRDPTTVPQRYVNGLCRFLDRVLNETKPDVVFCYAVAGAPAVALAEMCRVKDIPFCRLTHTRIGSGFVVDNDIAGLLQNVGRRFELARDGHEPLTPEAIKSAHEFLTKFRAVPSPPEYVVRNRAPTQLRFPLAATVFSAVHFLGFCLKEVRRGRWPETEVMRQIFKVQTVWRRRIAERTLLPSPNQLPHEFIYFPLHVEPEASTMVLSPCHTDQLAVIEALAKSAPANMHVVVKEHSPMLGLRPRGFYRQIEAMPRVTLLGSRYSTFDLLMKAALTAVITGTAAWEAILLGRPALIIGHSPFLPIGEGFVFESDLTRLPWAIQKALSLPPASDDTLTLYIAALQSEAFDMPTSLLWGEYNRHSTEQRRAAAVSIARRIIRIMNEATRDAASP